jgi:hypothetical protein
MQRTVKREFSINLNRIQWLKKLNLICHMTRELRRRRQLRCNITSQRESFNFSKTIEHQFQLFSSENSTKHDVNFKLKYEFYDSRQR